MRDKGQGTKGQGSRVKGQGTHPGAEQFGLADQVRRVAKVIRTIIGAPDYERYLAHVHQCHPGQAVMSREEFSRSRLEARYNQPGNRCC
ncbi:MAG TPA: YbdD/YjiX family protein [Gemmatimonadaceae bacterium]